MRGAINSENILSAKIIPEREYVLEYCFKKVHSAGDKIYRRRFLFWKIWTGEYWKEDMFISRRDELKSRSEILKDLLYHDHNPIRGRLTDDGRLMQSPFIRVNYYCGGTLESDHIYFDNMTQIENFMSDLKTKNPRIVIVPGEPKE